MFSEDQNDIEQDHFPEKIEIEEHFLGKFEDITKVSKNIYPQDLFEGLRFELTRFISGNFNIIHGIHFGSKQEPPNYSLTSNLVENEDTFLTGKTNTEGQFQGRIFHRFSPHFNILCSSQISSEPHSSILAIDAEYKFRYTNFTFRWATLGNYAFAYLQRLTPNLSAGAEIFYNHKHGASLCNFGGRYIHKNGIWTAIVSPHGHYNFTYSRNLSSKKCSLTTELVLQPSQHGYESLWLFGYDYQISRSQLKVQFDSGYKLAATFEDFPMDIMKLHFSTELDYKKRNYTFGFGFTGIF